MSAKLSVRLACLTLIAGLCGPSPVRSQDVMSFATMSPQFKLPIVASDEALAKMKEVRLYIKDGDAWKWIETVPPTKRHFDCQAPSNGKYHFAVVTVDKDGTPSRDIANLTPSMVVIVHGPVAVPLPAPKAEAAKEIDALIDKFLDQKPNDALLPERFRIKKIYTKNTTFNLPIQMDERVREGLSEVQLYVKRGSADWVKHEAVPPRTAHFAHRVPGDGEYWFAVVTVDKEGKASATVADLAPALRVVVDTTPPRVDAEIVEGKNGPSLNIQVADDNLVPSSLRAEVVLPDGVRALERVDGVFRLTPNDLLFPIRVTSVDASGNVGEKVLEPKKRP